jgi:GGDEF domain-containing protein
MTETAIDARVADQRIRPNGAGYVSSDRGVEPSTNVGTGLGDRDALLRDLIPAVAPSSEPRTLAILSLAGYYAAYGRFDGDALLRNVTAVLLEGLQGVRLYRLRSQEIAVLVPATPENAGRLLAEVTAALKERFPQARTVIGFGTALLPAEAREPILALRIADSRLPMRTPRERRLTPRS